MATGGHLRGRLLIATPPLTDPNFSLSVVWLLEHTEDGALGLVLNRPTDTPIEDPLPEWASLASDPGVLFAGGPVARGAAICLARSPEPEESEGFTPIVDDIGTVDLARSPESIGVPLSGVRVFLGYAGWGAEQLEQEIEAGAWLTAVHSTSDLLTPKPDLLWRKVLRRQQGPARMLALYPSDPMLN